MEKELRLIKNRGYFPVPQITLQDTKIKTTQNKNELMKDIDEVATAMLNAVKQSEGNYTREREQVRARDEQLRSVRQTDRTDCTVSLSLFADPERILRRLYVFAEEPCKSTTTTSEPCSPVFKEVQPRPSEHSQLEFQPFILLEIDYCT